MFDVMLLVGGMGCCAIAAGVVHHVRSDVRGRWRLLWGAAQLSR